MIKSCTKCGDSKSIDNFWKKKGPKDGFNPWCKDCCKKSNSEYQRKTLNLQEKTFYIRCSNTLGKNERNLESKRLYNKRNKHKRAATSAKYRASKLNATPSWANIDKIAEIYELAEKLSKESTDNGYHVDHIVPLQGDMVCGLHVEYNLQIISAQDNWSKGNKFNYSREVA